MTSKEDIITWTHAVDLYAAGNASAAVECFTTLSHYAKPQFNLGQIDLFQNQVDEAVEHFRRAVALDPFMAVAFFQLGYAMFLLGRAEDAVGMYGKCLELLNENTYIDYSQLALPFTLHRAELLYNRAVCYHLSYDFTSCARDLAQAQHVLQKASPSHEIIDRAAREGVRVDPDGSMDLFYVTTTKIFGVSEAKKKNVSRRMTLTEDKAEVVGGAEGGDDFVGFSGERMMQGKGMKVFGAASKDDAEESVPQLPRNDTLGKVLQRHATAPSSRPVREPYDFPEVPLARSRTVNGRSNQTMFEPAHRRTGSAPSPSFFSASDKTTDTPYTSSSTDTSEVVSKVAEYLVKSFGLDDGKTESPSSSGHSSQASTPTLLPRVLTRIPLQSPLELPSPPPVPPPTPVTPEKWGGSRTLAPWSGRLTPTSPTPLGGRKGGGAELPRRSDSLNGKNGRKGSVTSLGTSPFGKAVEEGRVGGMVGVDMSDKIRIKIHHKNDTVLTYANTSLTLDDLTQKAITKFSLTCSPRLAYLDIPSSSSFLDRFESITDSITDSYLEEGDLITMVEDEDLRIAVEDALRRGEERGREGCLEVWCLGEV
ncbi:hypothetical protein HK097_010003 [Rhizophlyctis rosea]|uniref:Uncharacterized protein n=1 Tax=Rhizophlyctis rosea TaxID=64517 RepID=A0AAD5S847_9FUNG|nr:hypothetical protein HK097_010003 [Rhizophlyctis rosea]